MSEMMIVITGLSLIGPEPLQPLPKAFAFSSRNRSRLTAISSQRKSFWRMWRSAAVRSLPVSKVRPVVVVMIIGQVQPCFLGQ